MLGRAFEAHSNNFFLTYAQSDFPLELFPEHLLDFITSVTTIPLKHYTAGYEQHEDGQPHLHLLLSFERPLRIRDQSFFDLIDLTGNVRHPNIQTPPARTNVPKWLQSKIDYTCKDGDFITTHPTYTTHKLDWNSIRDTVLQCKTSQEALQIVSQHDFKTALLYGTNIETNWGRLTKRSVFISRSMDQFNPPEELMEWYNAYFQVSPPGP